MKLNKKSINLTILVLTLISILSTITYAAPFTDSFRGGLLQINDFFAKEQYKPYSQVIDFFFFSILFIAIYMMGVRYAFKEVKRPEQVIAILLGLMTAFLLVLAGFSVTVLLPYVQWILYTLLFILYWWLLKGIKNKFWRFVLALLLTLLTIGLLQGLFSGLTAPDAEGFFKSLGKSFGAIQFPGLPTPGVPTYLSDLFGALPTVTTPTVTGPVTPTDTPKGAPPAEGGKGGFPWWAWVLIIAALAGGGFGALRWARGRGAPAQQAEQRAVEERTIAEIIAKIIQIITRKGQTIGLINAAKNARNDALGRENRNTEGLSRIYSKDPALLFTEEAERIINEEQGDFKLIMEKEKDFLVKLKELLETEDDLIKRIERWMQVIRNAGVDNTKLSRAINILINLVARNPTQDNYWTKLAGKNPEMGVNIIRNISLCYNNEKRQLIMDAEISNLIQNNHIVQLVKGKFDYLKEDMVRLTEYNNKETIQLNALSLKIIYQNRLLLYIKKLLEAGSGPAQSTRRAAEAIPPGTFKAAQSQLTVKINRPSPNSEHVIGRYIGDIEAEAEGPQSDLINSGNVANVRFVWYVEQGSTFAEANPTQMIHVGRTGPVNPDSKQISADIFVPEIAKLIAYLFDGERQLTRAEIPIKLIQLPRMRINLIETIKREKTLLQRISQALKREKSPARDRRGLEQASQAAEEIGEELDSFGEIYEGYRQQGIIERHFPQIHEKSKKIDRKVKAIARFIKLKLKNVKYMQSAVELEQLEEERLRALGEATSALIEASETQATATKPFTPTMRINLIKDLIREKKNLLQHIKNYLDSAIREGAPDLSMEDLMLAERTIGPVWEQLELLDKEEIYFRQPVELKKRLRNVQMSMRTFAQFIKSRIPKLRREAEQLELNFDRVIEE